ncbi:MAG: hypothetical protein HC789_11580 [Microcoleus sp. CSU_2_2]|nr:hypothetical protein [Microcoleus sp. SU_5_3]NJS10955.1 hypothetical protein [Microcoleus sp. CSU_2_2]
MLNLKSQISNRLCDFTQVYKSRSLFLTGRAIGVVYSLSYVREEVRSPFPLDRQFTNLQSFTKACHFFSPIGRSR